ncbi:hypothetical protein A2U01_0087868, partial [Trifolium medium]|nr:hypothetical protein [Trifolium medium]
EGAHVNVGEAANVNAEVDELMDEIDRFEGGAIPGQQQQLNWPYTHSEHELATLLHNMDLNTYLRLPNLYYKQHSGGDVFGSYD